MNTIQKYVFDHTRLQTEQQQIDKQLAAAHTRLSDVTTKQNSYQHRIDQLEKSLAHHQDTAADDIHIQIQRLVQQQEELFAALPQQLLVENGYAVSVYVDAVRAIDSLIAEGKQLDNELSLCIQKKEQLQTQRNQQQRHAEQLRAQLQRLEEEHSNKLSFYCDKIQGDCPYVASIK